MKEQLRVLTDRFVASVRGMNEAYFQHTTIFNRFGGAILTLSDRVGAPTVTAQDAARARRTAQRLNLHNEDGLPVFAALCHVADEHALLRALRARKALERRFIPSAHLTTAALLMALNQPDTTAYDQLAAEARETYDAMRKRFPFRTRSEDIPMCVLFALWEVYQASQQLDGAMKGLQPMLRSRSLGQVLLFAPEAEIQRVLELNRGLNERGLHLGKGKALVALGALTVIPESVDEIVDQVAAVEQRLRRVPEMSGWSVGGKERMMWSCLLTGMACADTEEQKRILTATMTALYSAYLPAPLEEPVLNSAMN
jgi:hypothetical protein